MVYSTEPTTQQSSQATQTSPSASKPISTPKPKQTFQQSRQSNASFALSCLLGLLFFTLIIHACVRSVVNSKPKHRNDNDGPVLGAIFSFVPVIGFICGIVTSLEEVSTGLGGQMTVIATSAAVVGLAWVVFGIGEEAKFSVYLAWVMWPIVTAFVVVVLGTWGWVAGYVEVVADKGTETERGKDGKGEKGD